jgi:alanine racemase
MGRIGVRWDRAADLIRRLTTIAGLRIEGVFTHFASADEADKGFTHLQIERFRGVIEALEKDGLHIPLRHAANSSALLDVPESYLNMVRPGLILYGLHPGAGVSQSIPIKPVLSLKTRITFVKEIEPGETVSYNRRFTARRRSRVATIPIGYGDGLDRHLSNRGQVLVGGRRAPIIGTICMDQTVIDVTDVPPPSLGDEVVVYGAQGGERIRVEEVARLLDTIPYAITCAIGRRVPRVMVGKPER